MAALGGALLPVLWDGLGQAPEAGGIDNDRALTLNLPSQGAGFEAARPAPLTLKAPGAPSGPGPRIGAPAALEARIAR